MTNEFKTMVAALCKSGESIINDLTPTNAHLLHMAVGVSGEAAELLKALILNDKENAIEELGDVEFYLQGILNTLELPANRFDCDLIDEYPAIRIVIYAGELLDAIKKGAVYNKEYDIALITNSILIINTAMHELYELMGIEREDVIKSNEKKLSKRYSSGSYSNEQAQIRADKTEGQ